MSKDGQQPATRGRSSRRISVPHTDNASNMTILSGSLWFCLLVSRVFDKSVSEKGEKVLFSPTNSEVEERVESILGGAPCENSLVGELPMTLCAGNAKSALPKWLQGAVRPCNEPRYEQKVHSTAAHPAQVERLGRGAS